MHRRDCDDLGRQGQPISLTRRSANVRSADTAIVTTDVCSPEPSIEWTERLSRDVRPLRWRPRPGQSRPLSRLPSVELRDAPAFRRRRSSWPAATSPVAPQSQASRRRSRISAFEAPELCALSSLLGYSPKRTRGRVGSAFNSRPPKHSERREVPTRRRQHRPRGRKLRGAERLPVPAQAHRMSRPQ